MDKRAKRKIVSASKFSRSEDPDGRRCRLDHVRDGDTIEVAGTPIRFGSLDCAERGTLTGQVATSRLRELIAGQSLTCALNGRISYDRGIGRCTLPDGGDLAAQMIREGLCGRYW